MSPGLASSGTGTVTSPVFSSTFTPSGAFSPGVNLVPSGGVVSLPSPSLKTGLSTLTSSPGLPEPSSYFGVSSSAIGLSVTTKESAAIDVSSPVTNSAVNTSPLTASSGTGNTHLFASASEVIPSQVLSSRRTPFFFQTILFGVTGKGPLTSKIGVSPLRAGFSVMS